MFSLATLLHKQNCQKGANPEVQRAEFFYIKPLIVLNNFSWIFFLYLAVCRCNWQRGSLIVSGAGTLKQTAHPR
jgi:hypothetical protein